MKQIRSSKFSKFLAYYLAIMMFLQVTQPLQMYALTSGPTQPEFNAFTPIGTSDMVDLASGDFNYNIPIMDVGGYPINLAYNSGVTMDQEASWVGLGWNLNVGQITRQVRGLPDDFRGDEMLYHNNLRDNVTIGTNFNFSPAFFGNDFPFSLGLGVQYNNYEGITWKPSIGVSFSLSEQAQVGFDLSGSVSEGATLKPTVKISATKDNKDGSATTYKSSVGSSFNSRKGFENVSISASKTREKTYSSGLNFRFNNTHNYTPTNRVGYTNTNKTFNATLGGEVFGNETIQMRVTGYGSYQTISDEYKNKYVGAYGYENSEYKNDAEGVLDFNRQNEQTVSKNTNALPVTNYTYDVYSIEGQGVSGMFRPFRSQVSYVYNDNVTDYSNSGSFGAEIGFGNLVHGGLNFKQAPTQSTTGLWSNKNNALAILKESNTDNNKILYEPTTFKLVGELNVDPEIDIFKSKIKESKPSRIKLTGGSFNTQAYPEYKYKDYVNDGGVVYSANPINSKIKREKRFLRNQNVQKISAKEAESDFFIERNSDHAKDYHNAGMKILQADGTTYVFGKSVYNTKKVEATFDVSRQPGNNSTGIVSYNGSVSGNHSANSDKYENVITTPKYAHTYLVTSILSSDYEDIDNNGISDSDLGTYTKFDYTKSGDPNYIPTYRWRTPYELNQASYNEGLKTSSKDQKGSYIYGEKEVTYLKKIETKTHIAFIDLQNRKDAMAVNGENGGRNNNIALKSIKTIRLYSKSELSKDTSGNAIDPGISSAIKPIKTAHFEYNYDLCPNIPSNSGEVEYDTNGNSINLKKGKLTLKKVYFTYRNSNMGKYTPYVFNYDENNAVSNPNYGIKDFDVWGNYKKNNGVLTTSEFPFVEQEEVSANENTAAWVLRSVKLPSGGEIAIETESDDYKYVQNKKAMQMFKVIGAGNTITPTANNKLYSLGTGHNKFIYVKVADGHIGDSDFLNNYLSENLNKSFYFKFLLNMTSSSSDYVTGYAEFDVELLTQISNQTNQDIVNNEGIASIPLKMLPKEGVFGGGSPSNPIAKAGWGFGRTYLNRAVYSLGGDEVNTNFISIVNDLVGSIGTMARVFSHPNKVLEGKSCAQRFDTQRSWIRLENPNGKKLGGGLRVKTITLSDSWDVMNNENGSNIYNEMYGQEYSYNLDDENHTSSGVATFEPNASPENPFVEPFYGDDGNYADRISAPKEMNYVEKPFGEDFFPSARVTYSRVTVRNLDKNGQNGTKTIKKHATGKVVTEHLTTYNHPTIVDYTDLDMRPSDFDSPLLALLDVASFHHLVASQGFTIETNDMNGKISSQQVYAENDDKDPISKVEYKYNVSADQKINSIFTTIDENGRIDRNSLMGIDYDVINDFNESNSVTEAYGFDGNLAAFLVGFFPGFVPMVLPSYSYHENILRTATTTKVVHKKGVLVEKIAYDLGSRVSTKNLAWDAKSGQVILTETTNEYDDKYYSFSYPAYWYYKSMGMAADNIDIEANLINVSGNNFTIEGLPSTTPDNDIKKYLKIGDELILGTGEKLWVYEYSGNYVKLMNRNGALISTDNLPSNLSFKVIRSGNKNMQMASMASITCMKNPIAAGNDYINDTTFGYTDVNTTINKVINASAVEYSDIWDSQCENGLPNALGLINGQGNPVNPFLYNTRGEWRAVKSYAFLTGRNNFVTTNTRKAGFFDDFNVFYKVQPTTRIWSIDSTNWTFASKVTRFSPYGAELENKDALERYSAAQYGYKYTLPMAVASNSRYQEMGFDSFEDYNDYVNASILKPHFGFSQALKQGVTVTNQKSHTGHNSLKVEAGQKATFTRKIDGCKQGEGEACGAIVVATPLTENICSEETTNIQLSSPVPGNTFTWIIGTVSPSITGFSGGSGNVISQTLSNQSTSNLGYVNYIVTPTYNGCIGDPVTVKINVSKKIEPVNFPETATLYYSSGDYIVYNAGIAQSSSFKWDVYQNGNLKYSGNYTGTSLSNIKVPSHLVNIGSGSVAFIIYQGLNDCQEKYMSTITATFPQN